MHNIEMSRNFPILENEQLLLRQLTLNDVQDMFEYSSVPIVTRYILYHHACIEDAKKRIQDIEKKCASGHSIVWGIQLKESRKMIGVCGFSNLNKNDNIAEISYTLNPSYWGKGFAVKAVKLLLEFGFKQMLLNRIEARCWVENLMVRLNMQFEGIIREQLKHQGQYHDIKLYSILSREYSRIKNQG